MPGESCHVSGVLSLMGFMYEADAHYSTCCIVVADGARWIVCLSTYSLAQLDVP